MGQPCIHCGEDCGSHPVIWDDKPFCCHGCSTVYQILNQKKLEKYYEIQPMAGIKVEQTSTGDKYAYLDHEEIMQKLLTFSDGPVSVVNLFVPAIHCASCIWLLENLHTLHGGIAQSTVNFPRKRVSITFNSDEISLRQVVELLASIHYVPEITLEQLDQKDTANHSRTLLLKLGIAGFSFMNVMLYNFPEYLPGGDQLGSLFTGFFGFMSLLLALPVVFYSANDYYLSAIKGLRHKIINIDVPITLGIFTLFVQSTYEIITLSGIGYMDSLIGLVFFLLTGKWYQAHTYEALSFERDYKSYFPVAVTIVEEHAERNIPLSQLKTDDVMIIRHQELIPADAILVEGDASIDYSFVTGESIPVPKQEGDLIYAGGRQAAGSIRLKVVKAVEQSYLTQLWNQDKGPKDRESRLTTLVDNVSHYFTIVILVIAALAGLYWLFNDKSLALFAFTSVLIIACPCALALTVPFTFGNTMRVFGRAGFYLKNTSVIERLRHIDTIVFDKTGTLTMSKSLQIQWVGDELSTTEKGMIKAVAAQSSHPLSVSIRESIGVEESWSVEEFREIPSMGTTAVIEGVRINMGSRKFVTGKEQSDATNSQVYCYINGRVAGYFSITNQYRPGLEKVITQLAKSKEMYLLSGDNESERANLLPIFGNDSRLYFNQSPQDKKKFIARLKSEGRHVLMIGDGLNDAGALMESDVGLAIADDIYSFSPACDGIIESGRFASLPLFIDFTRSAQQVVLISFGISFLYNVIGLAFAVQGNLSPIVAAILMPISSVSVVAFATFAVRFLARRQQL